MQLRILWEEILPRFPKIEVVGDPVAGGPRSADIDDEVKRWLKTAYDLDA